MKFNGSNQQIITAEDRLEMAYELITFIKESEKEKGRTLDDSELVIVLSLAIRALSRGQTASG